MKEETAHLRSTLTNERVVVDDSGQALHGARRACLPLLPSGPGGVHKSASRGTRPSTTSDHDIGPPGRPQGGIRSRCSGLRVQGTA